MMKKTIHGLYVSALIICIVVNALGQSKDWLLGTFQEKSKLEKNNDDQLTLANRLISRTFSTATNGATIGFNCVFRITHFAKCKSQLVKI